MRVLLAEGDAAVRRALARLLELEGYEVHTAASGSDLLKAVSTWLLGVSPIPYDVIVTAHRLPMLDPMTIVEGLRDLGWEAPIIVLYEPRGDLNGRHPEGELDGVHFVPRASCPEALEESLRALAARP